MVQFAQRLLAMSGSVQPAMDRAEAGCSGSVSAHPHGAQPRPRGHGRL